MYLDPYLYFTVKMCSFCNQKKTLTARAFGWHSPFLTALPTMLSSAAYLLAFILFKEMVHHSRFLFSNLLDLHSNDSV